MGILKGMMASDAQSGVLYGPKNNGTKGPAMPNPPKAYETDPKAEQMGCVDVKKLSNLDLQMSVKRSRNNNNNSNNNKAI